jgi:hypothetical protein
MDMVVGGDGGGICVADTDLDDLRDVDTDSDSGWVKEMTRMSETAMVASLAISLIIAGSCEVVVNTTKKGMDGFGEVRENVVGVGSVVWRVNECQDTR